jgi:hypothetical protein
VVGCGSTCIINFNESFSVYHLRDFNVNNKFIRTALLTGVGMHAACWLSALISNRNYTSKESQNGRIDRILFRLTATGTSIATLYFSQLR